ncbi:MAG: hypothetical protein WC792_04645 [Candidatus Micrarchaeia archaeon]|jgi:hypothetical protein
MNSFYHGTRLENLPKILSSGKLLGNSQQCEARAYADLGRQISESREKGKPMPLKQKEKLARGIAEIHRPPNGGVWLSDYKPFAGLYSRGGGPVLEFKVAPTDFKGSLSFPGVTTRGKDEMTVCLNKISLDNLVAIHVHQSNAGEVRKILSGFEKYRKIRVVEH